ncbi:hypothetical protein [Sphingobium fuliginis]|jgi:hypothetical protein|uniref:hypothetical protein n=1 Tax=Sphingobium fuliginis (strain ATCC 27551) TaxID=336203 RepID=UPI001C3F8FF1|nr:hypothetical protein [Sphingobium fuliginis]
MEASVTLCQHHNADRLAVAERSGVDHQLFDLARALSGRADPHAQCGERQTHGAPVVVPFLPD